MANIKQIMLPDGTTYDITMNTVNGHTVNSDVPANAIFTDENVLAEEYNTTTGNWNYPMWRANTSDAGHGLINDGFRYYQKLHDTSTAFGRSILQLGNAYSKDSSVTSEKDKNKRGEIRLYSEKTGYINLFAPTDSTGGKNVYFQDASGTLALLDDITDVNVKQTATSNTENGYPILLSNSTSSSTNTTSARKSKLWFKPGLDSNDWAEIYFTDGSSKSVELATAGFLIMGGYTVLNANTQNLLIRASSEQDYGAYLGVAKYNNKNYWIFAPEADGMLRLGLPNYRWGQIYSTSSTISTSDRNEKKDIVELDEKAKDLIMSLKPVSFKYINGETGRTHHGMISQDVEEELEDLGMTAMDFAGFCKDPKVEKYFEEDDVQQANPKWRVIEGEYTYGLRYEEFIPALIKTVQIQQQEIDELKRRLDILEGGQNS